MENEFYVYFITSLTSFSIYRIIINDINVKLEPVEEENFELSSKMIGRLIELEEDGYKNIKLLFQILSDEQIDCLYGENNKKHNSFNKLRLALF